MAANHDTLRALYDAFDARDLDAVLPALSEDVDWPHAWEGGRLRGRDAVRAYWTRQWAEIDPRVEPTEIVTRPDAAGSASATGRPACLVVRMDVEGPGG